MTKNDFVAETAGSLHLPDDTEPIMRRQVAINGNELRGTERERARAAGRLMNAFDLQCTTYVNMFFKFVADNKDVTAQQNEILRLDTLWKNWLRKKSPKYDYNNCKDFFSTKISFMIGPKKYNEDLAAKIKEGENKIVK